jgi:hypothetical protein
VHEAVTYDLVVDTTDRSPAEAAAVVVAQLET